MNRMYGIQNFLIILFVNVAILSCAQTPQSKTIAKQTLSPKDSLLLNKYFYKMDEYNLYSENRGKYIDSILQIIPDNAQMWQQRGMLLCKEKKYELGMPYLDSAVKYNRNQYLDYRAFMKCIFTKNYTASIEDFKAAKLLKGNTYIMDHTYDFYTGLCYLQLNKFDSAEYLFTQTIEDEKSQHGASWVHHLHWFYLGVVKYEKEEYQNAISCFDSSINIYSRFSDAKYYKALCLEKLKKYKEASETMDQADNDSKHGTTINEDNVIYEMYPYQVYKHVLEHYTKQLKDENKR